MSRDRITQIRIRGLRVIEDVTLDLDGLTVLIGDNGSGKSTILEAFEILRRAASARDFVQEVLIQSFGPLEELVRYGKDELTLGVVVASGDLELDYSFTVARIGSWDGSVVRESLSSRGGLGSCSLLKRENDVASVFKVGTTFPSESEAFEAVKGSILKLPPHELALTSFGRLAPPAFEKVREALSRIELQAPFETRPRWQQRELDLRRGARSSNDLILTKSVQRFGLNLPNCYHELRNRGAEVWEMLLFRAGLALGGELKDFVFVSTGTGVFEMQAVMARMPDKPVPMSAFSEGQLSFLLLVALPELEESRSVLLFDEPEAHLHPSLVDRALFVFEEIAEKCPVLLATHSDRLLDALESPEKSVVLCDLDEKAALRLLRPDRRKLDLWLENYRGLGSLRAEGYDAAVAGF